MKKTIRLINNAFNMLENERKLVYNQVIRRVNKKP